MCLLVIIFKDLVIGGGGRSHKQERPRKKQRDSQAESELSSEPDVGLDPMMLRLRPEPKPSVWRLTDLATQTPLFVIFFSFLLLKHVNNTKAGS